MKSTTKLLLVTMIVLMVSLGCTSATDVNDTTSDVNIQTHTNDMNLETSIQKADTKPTITKNVETTSAKNTTKTIKKETKKTTTKNNEDNKEVKRGSSYQITEADYDLYFRHNDTTNKTETTDLVQAGDIIDLRGVFTAKNFTIDKANITLTSIGRNARLYNCTAEIQGLKASGSKIINLTITNNNYYGTGIYVNITNNVTIEHNKVVVNGPFSFALAADKMNNSYVYLNELETKMREDTARTHTAATFGSCYYNRIANNTVKSDAANGIYLSVYGSGLFQGGYSSYNNITGNKVIGGDTSWSYTIQVMGTGNRIAYNAVNGGYRGISTQDMVNNTIINNSVNGTNEGIYACEGAIVINNSVHVNGSTTGITIGGDGVLLTNNNISSNNGSCIVISANKVTIENNDLWSTESKAIYGKGQYSNIIIRNNTIRAKTVGIEFRRQSTTKRINNILVTRNTIQSEGYAAIDFEGAGSLNPEDSNVTVDESNTVNCSAGRGLEVSYIPPSSGTTVNTPDSNKTYIVTPENYRNYFQEDFTANTRVILKNDTVILKGTFTNKSFIFPMKVHVIGDNCVIKDGTISLIDDASASTIKGIKINNTATKTENVHGIEVREVNNCNITNCTIYNYDNWESIGIWLYGASGSTVKNNYIYTSGDYVNYAITVYSSDLNTIKDNTIFVNQSGIRQPYADEIMLNHDMGTIPEILHNYGIILLYSSFNTIENNNVSSKSGFKTYTFPDSDCKNSIVGIDLYYDSNYNTILSNRINMKSYGPYTYGMGVLGAHWGGSITSANATNNSFMKNNVTVTGGYFATGFIAGLNSVNTKVEDNIFEIHTEHNKTQRGDYTYGLTLESALNTTINNNKFNTTGAAVYTIEIFDSSNHTIYGNDFYSTGSYVYGIAAYMACDNKIYDNNFYLRSGNYGTVSQAQHSDALPYGNAGIMLMTNSFRNNITLNTINTNAQYTVNMTYQAINNTIKENSLQSTTAKTIGDKSVRNDHASNVVSNNFLHFTTASISPIQATVGQPFTVNGMVTSTTKDLNNLTVNIKVGVTNLGTVKVAKNGAFTLKVNQTNFLGPRTYTLIANVAGNNFQNATTTAALNLNKTLKESIVKVNKVKGIPGNNVTLVADVTDALGAKLSGNVTFKLDDKILATEDLTLGRATYKYRIPMNAIPGLHKITVIYNGNKDSTSSQGTSTLGIQTGSNVEVAAQKGAIGDKITITAKITSEGKDITGGNAVIMVNGVSVKKTSVSAGKISYVYTIPTTMTCKVYNIKVRYDGNDVVSGSTGNNNLTVVPKVAKLSMNTTNAAVGKPVKVTIKVSDKTGAILAHSGSMTIAFNGVNLKNADGTLVTGKVNSQGNVIFTFNAPNRIGKNNLTFKYSGDNQFAGVTQTFKESLNIYKQGTPTKIVVDKIKGVYGKNTTFIMHVYDNNGNPMASGKATFKLNHVTLKEGGKAITLNVTNGVATYTYFVKNTAKTYKLTGVYSDGSKRLEQTTTFTSVQDTKTMKLNAVTTTGNSVKITGKMYDSNGKQISANTKITVKVNGKTIISKQIVKNGEISLTIDSKHYKTGVNNITVIGGENSMYKMVTNYTTIIKNTKNSLSTLPTSAKAGEKVSLSAYITDANGKLATAGSVVFKLNGKTITSASGEQLKAKVVNGVASVLYTMPPAKKYKLTTVYANGSKRLESTTSLTVTN